MEAKQSFTVITFAIATICFLQIDMLQIEEKYIWEEAILDCNTTDIRSTLWERSGNSSGVLFIGLRSVRSQDIDNIVVSSDNYSMMISPIRVSDEGVYTCSHHGKVLAVYNLSVKVIPELRIQHQGLNVSEIILFEEAKEVRLSCIAFQTKRDLHLYWMADTTKIKEYLGGVNISENKFTDDTYNIERSINVHVSSGFMNFTCIASNSDYYEDAVTVSVGMKKTYKTMAVVVSLSIFMFWVTISTLVALCHFTVRREKDEKCGTAGMTSLYAVSSKVKKLGQERKLFSSDTGVIEIAADEEVYNKLEDYGEVDTDNIPYLGSKCPQERPYLDINEGQNYDKRIKRTYGVKENKEKEKGEQKVERMSLERRGKRHKDLEDKNQVSSYDSKIKISYKINRNGQEGEYSAIDDEMFDTQKDLDDKISFITRLSKGTVSERWLVTFSSRLGNRKYVFVKPSSAVETKQDHRKKLWDSLVKKLLDLTGCPYILTCLGSCVLKDHLCLIQTYIPMDTLQDHVTLSAYELQKRVNDDKHVLVNELLAYSLQVALGMTFITSHGFSHPTLSITSILLTEDKTCKLYDFCLREDALSFTATSTAVYASEHQCRELKDLREYTMATDVWLTAFTVWQIFSQGALPLAAGNDENEVKSSFLKPELCPPTLYNFLIGCWSERRKDRPKMKELSSKLTKHVLAHKTK